MRHGKKFNHLSRTKAHREAMLSNMACSLIQHKRINTTLAKAKALRKYVEPLITKSKTDTTHSRRVVFSYLKNKEAASELFREVAPKINDRPGGYTRIIKLNNRLGDNAQMAMIELVDFNELLLSDTSSKKKSRRRRGGKKKAADSPVTEVASNDSNEAIEEAAIVSESVQEEKVEEATDTAEATEVVEEQTNAEVVEEEVKAEASSESVEVVEEEVKAEETTETVEANEEEVKAEETTENEESSNEEDKSSSKGDENEEDDKKE